MIPVAKPNITKEDIKEVNRALKSGYVSSQGEYIKLFEKSFAEYCGRKYGVLTSSGTTALHLALEALELKQWDTVLIPVLTFIATANAVTYANLKLDFVDIDRNTWNIDPISIRQKMSADIKVIIPVHLFGNPCVMDEITKIADKFGLYIIEDCAEAHGAEYKGKKIGSFGDISCFSFYGNKIITTGEGGICLTDNKKLYEQMLILRDHGMSRTKKYWHPIVGFNYRMTNLQAALGYSQLKRIDKIIRERNEIASLYRQYLDGNKNIELPYEMEGRVYWVFPVLVKNNRDEIIKKLYEQGIETRPFFYLITDMPPYRDGNDFVVAKDISKRGIMLPFFVGLTKKEVRYICEILLHI